MRRKDREITDISAIDTFLTEEKILRIAFYDDGDIYIVPVNYGFRRESGKCVFYFHGAKAGRKYELAGKSPYVGFETDGRFKMIEGGSACDYSANFQSVTGTGRLSLIEDTEAKRSALDCLMDHQAGEKNWEYTEKMLGAVAVFRLEAEKISCKAK